MMTTQTTVNWKSWTFQSYRLNARGKKWHQVSTWSLVTNSVIDGNKEAPISRLMKVKQVNDNPDTVKQRLKAFMESTGAMSENQKPTIEAWYDNSSLVLTDSTLLLTFSNSKQRCWRRNQFDGTVSLQCLLSAAMWFRMVSKQLIL